jgi:hypothetical protein
VLCNALELFMNGTWSCLSKKTKMPMMSMGAQWKWHWEIPSYRRFSSNTAIMVSNAKIPGFNVVCKLWLCVCMYNSQ